MAPTHFMLLFQGLSEYWNNRPHSDVTPGSGEVIPSVLVEAFVSDSSVKPQVGDRDFGLDPVVDF